MIAVLTGLLFTFLVGAFGGLIWALSWALSELVDARYPNNFIHPIATVLATVAYMAFGIFVMVTVFDPYIQPMIVASRPDLYDPMFFFLVPSGLGLAVVGGLGIFLFQRAKAAAKRANAGTTATAA